MTERLPGAPSKHATWPSPHRLLLRRLITLVLTLASAGLLVITFAPSAAADTGIFSDSLEPAVDVDSDARSAELGVTFVMLNSGEISALQFYRGPEQTGGYLGTLWSADREPLARTWFSPASTGWQTAMLRDPVRVEEGDRLTASYFAKGGAYPVTEGAFTQQRGSKDFTLPRDAGVFSYSDRSTFPTSSFRSSNYLVDVVFNEDPASTPSPTATPSATRTPVPTASPTASGTPTATRTPSPTASPTVATPTPSPTPTPTRTPSPTATPTPTVSSTSAPGQAGAGWTVSEKTVGLAPLGLSCSSLPSYTGPAKPTRGTVISGRLITTGLDLSAGGITIERSCIRPTSVGRGLPAVTTTDNNDDYLPGDDLVTIRDSEINGTMLSQELAAYSTGFIGIATLQRNYVHHFGSGIALFHAGTRLNSLIENNYVTDMLGYGNPATTGNHSDAFTIRDFTDEAKSDRTATVRNNRFDCDSPNATGAFFIQAYAGRIDNVTIEGNLLEGNGYQLALEAKNNGYSNVTAINNRFSGTGFGPVYAIGGSGFARWENNYRYSPSGADARGSVISAPWPV